MKILVADDDLVTRRAVENLLRSWGYTVITAGDAHQAWHLLHQPDPPPMVILDRMMPGMDGAELAKKLRTERPELYILLLTSLGKKEDLIAGLEAGANDYLIKPFDKEELRVRINAGARIITLQQELTLRVQELEKALSEVKQLQGLLPICSYCKKIRDNENYWQQVEQYIGRHTEITFSHGICPSCYDKILKPEMERIAADAKEKNKGTGL